MRPRTAAVGVMLFVTVACSSSTPVVAVGSSTSSSSTPSSSASFPPFSIPSNLKPGDLFKVQHPWKARYSTTAKVGDSGKLTIDIVAVDGQPAFEPSIITGSPGQTIHLTVYQTNDKSADFQHNFSIDPLGVDEDIPVGVGKSISTTITLPQSGGFTFYCYYHVDLEQHAGEFVVG